jgi:uncharacterized protein DUF3108
VDVGAPSLEGFRVKHFGYFLACFLLVSCSSAPLKYEKAKELEANTEFDKAVKVEEVVATQPEKTTKAETAPAVMPKATPSEVERSLTPTEKTAPTPTLKPTPPPKTSKKSKAKPKKAKKAEEPAQPTHRQPEIEDDIGFQGRRPLQDPFRVGEVITHDVSYLTFTAGALKLKVEPMVSVNGRKAYNFVTEIQTYPVYSRIYSVNDRVETYVDYETLVPRTYALHVKESGQLREARMLFDDQTNHATFWEKKVTEKHGEEEKKQAWDILPYSQNVFSAIFYMRNFHWEPGKEIAFRVADDEQNLIFKGKCLRREKIDTDIGEKEALVIKPEIILQGKFKPVGDIYVWLSDDEHKYPLRIEAKIKIGSLVSEVTSITPGHN